MVCIGKIPLSAKGITDEITYNHPIDICSVGLACMDLTRHEQDLNSDNLPKKGMLADVV